MKCETYMLQDKSELKEFIDLLRKENVGSYLEIGSKFGGSFWPICNALPKGARCVSVDLPHGDKSFKENETHLRECVKELSKRGYDAHLIIGDSTDSAIIERVRALGPFDCVFIDANHTIKYVEADYANYSPMFTKLLAFHDIGDIRPGGVVPSKKPIEVPIVWERIKRGRKHLEIIKGRPDFAGVRCNGIGVLWAMPST